MIRLATPDKHNIRLLQRVYEVYPDEAPLEKWLKKVAKGEVFLYEQSRDLPTIDYAGLVELKPNCLQARVGGGLEGRMDVPEMFNFLKFMCYILDKPLLRLYGRRGWWKHLKHLDFELKEEVSSSSSSKRASYIYEYKINKERGGEDGR